MNFGERDESGLSTRVRARACHTVRGFVVPKGAALGIKWAAQGTGYAEVTDALRKQDRGVLEATPSTCLDSSVAIWKGKYYVCAFM